MSMHLIQSYSGSDSPGGITFLNIPQTYTHLQLRIYGKSTFAGTSPALVYLNDDFNANYSFASLDGGGSGSAGNQRYDNRNLMEFQRFPGTTSDSSLFGVGIIDFIDYRSTSFFKTVKAQCGFDANGSGQVHFGVGVWRNTAAINRILVQLYTAIDNSSVISLYGITQGIVQGS